MEWSSTFEDILRRYLPSLEPSDPLRPDAQLIDLGLDSLGTVDLLISLEDELSVLIPDAALVPETFATAFNLWSAVDGCRN